MFIAMNRFQVHPERSDEFERSWRERDSYLAEVPGFVEFALLKGDNPGEYISHSRWESRDAFKAWTQSDAFTRAHASGLSEDVLADHPRVSMYESVLEARASVAR
ncbi:MAG: antibiotic biosynthesis monooxygenase [Dehalococcoidia bacterium]|nr:antibiotic biosynthesis monooxygenase [Dehalococcoidia bacterium]MCB9483794.1 antibiotic biosynthesis monooxygenase [Dehalococcoidia bacterium]MCB9492011.1 antibiotic biosynthesis monooxygenase [Dehalococcoidia bacterium]